MRLSASISFMFREHPFLERFAAAREAGFAGVEIQRLAEGDVREMARAARDAGMPVVLVNVSALDWANGGDGLSGVPGREPQFFEAFLEAIDAAALLQAQHVHLGPSRVPAGSSPQECMGVYRANIGRALAHTRGSELSLLLEAMNRVESPTALLPDLRVAADLIRSVPNMRLGLQFDVYHAAMNGDDPLHAYRQCRDLVRHVQFADMPGRHEPGTGTLGIPALLREFARDGYAGWYGAEYHPSHATTESLGWMTSLSARSTA